jgi:hypothetical protein
MNLPEFKINRSGFNYYSELPENFRLATIDDFIVNDKRRIGLLFLIQWIDDASFYQVCYVSINLTRAILGPHLEDKRVFVQAE